MRVGISGTHGTGKTTLAQALCARLPGHVQVHGLFARHQSLPQGAGAGARADRGPQPRQLGHLPGRGRGYGPLRRAGSLGCGRGAERGEVRGEAGHGEVVRIQEQRVSRRHVPANTGLRVHRIGQDLVGRCAQRRGGPGYLALLPLVALQHQAGQHDENQGDQRDRDHDHALDPDRPVEPPLVQPVPRRRQ